MKSQAPRVSVAMATFQGAKFIEEQFQSILRQSVPLFEIVVSDDGSCDSTLATVVRLHEQYKQRNPRWPTLRVLQRYEDKSGIVDNFVRAMTSCAGDFIALSDQDDIWLPNKIELLLATMNSTRGGVLVASDARLMESDGKLTSAAALDRTDPALLDGRPDAPELARYIARETFAPGMTMMFRADLLETALPIPVGWLHDYWLITVALSTGAVAVRSDCLVYYRQHGANAVGLNGGSGFHPYRSLRKLMTSPSQGQSWERHEAFWPNFDADRFQDARDRNSEALEIFRAKADFERSRNAVLTMNRMMRARAMCRMVPGYKRFSLSPNRRIIKDILRPNL